MFATPMFLARSRGNKKTGDVPTVWIGRTRDESIATCACVECPLLHAKYGGLGGSGAQTCYAQHGSPSFAHTAMIKAADNGKDYGPEQAIAKRSKAAKMVRLGAIGDPALAQREPLLRFVELAREAGLAVVGYTHGWRRRYAADLRGVCMASCDDINAADQAIDAGWRAAVVLPANHKERRFTTPAGNKGIVCPAILNEAVSCNDCRLCDPTKKGPVIGFPDHGPGSKARKA